MKLKGKKRLLDELIKGCKDPKEFIYSVMALQNQTANDVCENIDMTAAHFYVCMNQIMHGQTIGTSACARIAQGLDIDPLILCRIVADYKMTKYLQNNQ